MKFWPLLLLVALTHYRYAEAAPSCFPGEPAAFQKELQIAKTAEGCIAFVHCDEGHVWRKYFVVGNWASCKAAEASMDMASWVGLTHDQKVELYDTLMATAKPDPEDVALMEKAKTLYWPANPPPSGLVTQAIAVYKRTPKINAPPVWTKFATVKTGIPCDTQYSLGPLTIAGTTQLLGPLYRIDRADPSFKLDSKVDVLPEVAYGICR